MGEYKAAQNCSRHRECVSMAQGTCIKLLEDRKRVKFDLMLPEVLLSMTDFFRRQVARNENGQGLLAVISAMAWRMSIREGGFVVYIVQILLQAW